MNDLDFCLEVASRSCQPLRYIRHWLSRKPLEIEAWFQRNNNRMEMAYWVSNGHVLWLMTSRDPKVLWGSTVGYPSDSLASCLCLLSQARTSYNIHNRSTVRVQSDVTSIHIFQWLLEYETEKHWNCVAHFRYRGSIEYRDTWDGIVIVAPISGIAQH